MERDLYVYYPDALDSFPIEEEDLMEVDSEVEKESVAAEEGYEGYNLDDEIDYEKWYKFYMTNKDF